MSDWENHRSILRHRRAAGDTVSASQELLRAIELLPTSDMRELAGLFNQLAKLYLEAGDSSAAELAARKAIEAEIQYGFPPSESDHLAANRVMLAQALQHQGKYIEALVQLDLGIEGFSLHHKSEDQLMLNLAILREDLANNRWREGKP